MLIEIYKSLNKASAENFFNSLFGFKFRQSQFLLEPKIPSCNSGYHGKKSIRYFGPQIWNSVPFEIRNAATLEDFSRKIKCWKPEECLCRLCMHYEREVGFVGFVGCRFIHFITPPNSTNSSHLFISADLLAVS